MTSKSFCALFSGSKILTMKDLASAMDVTSKTIYNHLKKAGTLTSYNKNGRYYTLPSTPCFNENGVWIKDGVCFSKRGSLKETFIFLITTSDKGMTSVDISEALLFPSDQIINIYRHLPEIQREKVKGRYVYFSSKSDTFLEQKQARMASEEIGNPAEITKPLHDEEGIAILVDRINHPMEELKGVSKRLKKKYPALEEKIITSFLQHHSLLGASEFAHVETLTQLTKKSTDALLSMNLFPDPPTISFDIRNEDNCPDEYTVEKSTTKKVSTLHLGTFCARNIVISTKNGTMGSQELLGLVSPHCTFGFDVVAAIGQMIFHEHKQASEVRSWLAKNNVTISESEIEHLAKKYIVYLSIIHEQSTSKIVDMMSSNGGYILHLDGLGSSGGERLMTGIDSLSNLVLNNIKISSENSDEIIPFLKLIESRYGAPLCVVQDMGKGIMNAVKAVFSETPILICHFHFLRDLGKDLLKSDYDIISKRLTHFRFLVKLRIVKTALKISVEDNPHSIERIHCSLIEGKAIKNGGHEILQVMLYTLLEWILSWKEESAGYGFPFDRPKLDLAMRLSEAWVIICDMPKDIIFKDPDLEKYYIRVKAIISEIIDDKELQDALACIHPEIVVFDKLRDAMRIAPKDGGNGLNDNSDSVEINTIESCVTKFIKGPESQAEFTTKSKKKSFFDQLKKYWSQLFADPIDVNIDGEKTTIIPQRTNNLMERFFRDFSRGSKRKSGRDNIGRMIDAMVPDTPIFKNFEGREYLDATIGAKSLPQVFAELDNHLVREKMKELNVNDEKIHEKIRKCLDVDFLTKKMSVIAKNLKPN
jgi:hypothetical protein